MAPMAEKSLEPAHYKLHGWGAWLHIEDEAVSTVRHEDIFGSHGGGRGNDQCAYLLLYCATAPTQS
ncbi:hypothetical protein BJV77DRAFT_1046921 [Russula vinacea]|nr:hypothetical protein BJV77DRAFT_1046921 [Russula vinacea]